jgi:acetyl esterase/lipase
MRLPSISLALPLALALAACAMPETSPTPPRGPDGLMAWPDLLERPRPEPSATIRYGDDALQVVDLWLPEGPGPHPTVLMIHGGCWQTEIADRRIMNWIADDLRRRGIAVWNIDYRGVDRPGGGYPGTFLDAAAAADALRDHAPRFNLDIDPLVAIGHSAGGHLALWLGARPYVNQRTRTVVISGDVRSMADAEARADRMLEAIGRIAGASKLVSEASEDGASALAVFPSPEAASAAVAEARRLAVEMALGEVSVRIESSLPESSPLAAGDPIEIDTAISLGGLQDLELAAQPPGSGCGTEVIARLTNGNFADTSVPRLAPLAIGQVLINGRQDRIIPLHFASSYAEKLAAVRDYAKVRIIDRTGHVELITPETAAWAAAVEEIEKALGR